MANFTASNEAKDLMRRWRAADGKEHVDWIKAKAMYYEGASLTKIGAAVGTTKQSVSQHARRYEWKRAIVTPEASLKTPTFEVGIETDDIDKMLGEMVVGGLKGIAKRIERLTPAEVERLQVVRARVREQRERELNSKAGASGISLDAMQAKHQALRKHVARSVDDEVAGVLHDVDRQVDGPEASTLIESTSFGARERASRAKAAGRPSSAASSGGSGEDELVLEADESEDDGLDELPEVATPGALVEMLAGIEGAA